MNSWIQQDRCLDCSWRNDRVSRRCEPCHIEYLRTCSEQDLLADFVKAALAVANDGHKPTQEKLEELRKVAKMLMSREQRQG